MPSGYPPAVETVALDRRQLVTHVAVSFAVLVGVLLALGLAGKLFVFDSALGRMELDWTRWVAEHRAAPLDALARVGSSLTDTWTVIGVVGGVTVVLWAARHGPQALLLPLALSMEFATFLLVSTVIGRDRPQVNPLGSVPSTSSFPSGHVAAAVVVYGGLALIIVSFRTVRRPAYVVAGVALVVAFVGSSRWYEGVHHPTDLLAGVLLGIGALCAAAVGTDLLPTATGEDGSDVGDRSAAGPAVEDLGRVGAEHVGEQRRVDVAEVDACT